MASKIGLVLALDGEKEFQAGLKAAKGAVTETKAALDQVKKQYEGQSNTLTALNAQSEKYSSIQTNLNTQLDIAKAGLANANANYQKINDTLDQHQQKLNIVQGAMKIAGQLYGENSSVYQNLAAEEQKEIAILDQQNQERLKQVSALMNWESQVRKTETAITSNNNAIKKNNAYIQEAKNSADDCATSIDRFGKSIKSVEDAVANPELAKLKTEYDQYKESVSGVVKASEQYKSSLSSINGELAGAKASVSQANEAYAGQLNTTEALKAKLDALSVVEGTLADKQAILNAAITNAANGEAITTAKLAEYRDEISKTVQFMEALEQSGMKYSEVYREQAAVLAQLKAQEEAEFASKQKYAQMQGTLTQELARTEQEMVTTGNAMASVSKLWSEAVLSADGVATSIDRMGNAIKNADLAKVKQDYAEYKETLTETSNKQREYGEALAQVNAKQAEAKSALDKVKSAYEGQLNTSSALEAKQKALADAGTALGEKQKILGDAIKNTGDAIKIVEARLGTYSSKIADSESKLQALANAGKKNTEEYEKEAAVLAELKAEEQADLDAKAQLTATQSRYQSELASTTADLEKNARATKQNAQYMKEAETNAEHCATSIDGFGKATKEAEGLLDALGKRLTSAFSSAALITLAVSGIRKLGNALKDCVTTGMEFEAAMSRVAAVSQSGDTQTEMLSEKAKQLGRTTVFTAEQSAQAMEQLALAGWKTESIISGIDGVLNLASASGMDLAKSAEYVSDNLNAFRKSADDASNLADIMAYAMANSSQTAEDLGEAYGKVASTAAAFGYSTEEVTGVLMTMANSGKKGSEAGTALNTIFTRLATNTSKCSEAIAEYNNGQDIMYDKATGEMRPVANVLEDLYAVWVKLEPAQRNALAKTIAGQRQYNALYTVMAGMESTVGGTSRSFSEYAKELENCTGAAKDMAAVSLDNLAGDVELMNDAFDGLGIAIEGNLDSKLRNAVQFATSAVNALSDLITTESTALDKLVSNTDDAINSTKRMLDNTDFELAQADINYESYKEYIEILDELSQKQNLSAFESAQVKMAVEGLSLLMPSLANMYKESGNSLSFYNQELSNNLKLSAEATKLQAYQKVLSEYSDERARAEVELAIAEKAVEEAYEGNSAAVYKNRIVREKAKDVAKEAADKEGILIQLVDEQKEAMGLAADVTEEEVEALTKVGQTAEEAAGQLEELSSVGEHGENLAGLTEEEADAVVESVSKIIESYEDMEEEIKKSISNSIDMMKEFSGGEEISMYGDGEKSGMLQNLQSQIDGITQWKADMETLAGQIGKDFTQEMYDSLAAAGPQAANQVRAIAQEVDAESGATTESFKELSRLWAEALALDDDVTDIMANTSVGKEAVDLIKQDLDTGLTDLETYVAENTAKAFTQGLETAKSDISDSADDVLDGAFDSSVDSIADDLEEAGQRVDEMLGESISANADSLSDAGEEVIQKAVDGAENAAESGCPPVGKAMDEKIASGVTSNGSAVTSAAQTVIDTAASSVDTSGMHEVGANAAAGMAQGMLDNIGVITTAGTALGDAAKAAAMAALDEHSPSRVFRNEVGKNVALGFAFGIRDNAHVATAEAKKMSQDVIKEANKWLKNYKKTSKTTLADEEYYWTQVLKHLDAQTGAYAEALKKLTAVRKKLNSTTSLKDTGFTDSQTKSIEKKLKNLFDVSKYTGSGKSKKKKDASTYYADVYKAAQTYAKNQQILNEWSDEQQLVFYKKLKTKLKKGTQAWYDATQTIKQLQQQIDDSRTQAAIDLRAQTASNQEKILSYYKTFKNVSLKAEMDYWNAARHQFAANTDEHIEADQKYVDARKAYYEALTELDEQYKSDYKDIVDDLEDTIKDLEDAYKDAVKSRRDEIMSSMSLFEAFDTEGQSSDKLIENLQSQVDALAVWEQDLRAIRDRGISQELYETLYGEGIDGAANVHAIAKMTDEQLKQYQELYDAKYKLANMQATEENKGLLADTNKQIQEAQKNATEALGKLNKEYTDQLKEYTGSLASDLSSMLGKAPELAEDAVSKLFSAFSTENVAKYDASGVSKKLDSEYASMKVQAESAGTEAVAGLMKGLQNEGIITSGAKATVEMITKALKEAAEIHSPSRLMKREVGELLGEGVAEGMEESSLSTAEAAEEMIRRSLNAARDEMERQETSLNRSISGINIGSNAVINDLLGSYAPQTVVNVDNSSVSSQIAQLNTSLSDMMSLISSMQVVLDSGETVGALSGKMDVSLATEYRRRHRGTLR